MPVEDAWQRQGLGTALTERLLRQAQHADVPCVHADVLADNAAMLRVLRRTGDVVRRTEWGVASLTLPTAAGGLAQVEWGARAEVHPSRWMCNSRA